MSSTLLDKPRASLARAVRSRIAGDRFDSIHARIWHTPGPRWYTEDDAIWRVHADTAMFVGGIRALLLQSLHPVAMLGVSEHSDFRVDPWGRLQRTSQFIATTTYGTIADAERIIGVVRGIHETVKGTTADGKPYRADDPHLLSWVHITEIDSFLAGHQAFGAEPLDPQRADDYVRQAGQAARRLGVVDPPESTAELEAQLQSFRPELAVTDPARETVELLLRTPPLTGPARVGYAALAAGAVSILPPWARTQLGLSSSATVDRLLARPLTRQALATIRWALSGSTAV